MRDERGRTGLIIVNADDFGRSRAETDAALACYKQNRITSVTAMVFMEDSERAADLAKEAGLDVGLHLNLSQRFTAIPGGNLLQERHGRVVRFMTSSRYALLLYNPVLRREFHDVYRAQVEEFTRLYGSRPSHIDGHQHRHLCANVLLDDVIPAEERVRRNFSFWPHEKSFFNRGYRRLIDWILARRYRVTDFFFSLQECLQANQMARVFNLSQQATVELMTHPLRKAEYSYLMSDQYFAGLRGLTTGTYAAL